MVSRNIFSMRVNFSFFHTVSWQHWLRLSLIFTAIRTFKYFFILTYSRSMYAFLWNTSGKIVGTSIKPLSCHTSVKNYPFNLQKKNDLQLKGSLRKALLHIKLTNFEMVNFWTLNFKISFINPSSTFLLFIH